MKRAEDLAGILAAVEADMQAHLGHGRVADYIPALARVDPKRFALTLERFAALAGRSVF